MTECPRFEYCSAPLCPLDPLWRERTMLKNERVCHYLSEASKPEAHERYRDRPDAHLYDHASSQMKEMREQFPELDKRLDRSSKTRSKLPMVQLELDLDPQPNS